MPSAIAESCESNSRSSSGPHMQIQDEELRVNAEPVQWWDVCRRSNWPEREECITSIRCGGEETVEMVLDTYDCEDNDSKYSTSSPSSSTNKDFAKTTEKSHWYFSNAEVQVSSGRIPIWQKAKIRFYTIVSPSSEGFTIDCAGGEIEIEKFSLNEVEIKCKDLLPVFDHQRELNGAGYLTEAASEILQPREKYIGNTVKRHPKAVSDECSNAGNSRNTGHLLAFEDVSAIRSCETSVSQSVEKSSPCVSGLSTILMDPPMEKMEDENMGTTVSTSFQNNSSGSFLSYGGRLIRRGHSSDNTVSNEASNMSDTNSHSKPTEPSPDLHHMQGFSGYFHESCCKASELDDCHESAEAVTDADSSSSHCEREKPEEDADNDELLGGVFPFSEEG